MPRGQLRDRRLNYNVFFDVRVKYEDIYDF